MAENFTRMVLSSLTNKTVHDNWTEIVLEEVDDNEEIVRMIQVITRPPIIVLGTVENLLAFFTMQRGSLKRMSTCFYMAVLGLADTGEFSTSTYLLNVGEMTIYQIYHRLVSIIVTHICLTSVTRVKCGVRSTLCWTIANISGST